MIECRALVKTFGDLVAVDGVSLQVRAGIYALLGPNGAGKSTLLKMLTGLLAPDSGNARVCELDVHRQAVDVRRIIGVLPEGLGLFDSLTVEEHLELCGPVYGLSAQETRMRADALLRVLRLDSGRDRFLDQCSHGMRKKTALAMALIHNPRALFLDEPFEGIDPISARTIQDLLVSIALRGTVVFLTSHILAIVEQLADEIAIIRGGRIVWTSSTAPRESSLEQIYFDLMEKPCTEELPWLGSRPF